MALATRVVDACDPTVGDARGMRYRKARSYNSRNDDTTSVSTCAVEMTVHAAGFAGWDDVAATRHVTTRTPPRRSCTRAGRRTRSRGAHTVQCQVHRNVLRGHGKKTARSAHSVRALRLRGMSREHSARRV